MRPDRNRRIFLVAATTDPGYNDRVEGVPHKHLTRLDRVWIRNPVYFVTTCTLQRRRVLANSTAHDICIEVWKNARPLYGWHVGRYVIMPDHVHFFCVPELDAKPLETFVGKWKEWTAKYLCRRAGIAMPLWQGEFFDHLLRSSESHSRKWEYVRRNPDRAGLVAHHEDWPYQGCLTDLRIDDMETL
ncbi:MAG: transposase [Terrimicrobiaceae bacterium]|nr:transposase [Terrimicrobiaceae bacterium]